MRVFIIGIAGGTGLRVARIASMRGDVVGGLYRRAEQFTLVHRSGGNGIAGDIAKISEQDLAGAMASADAIVFAAGAGEQDDDAMIDAVDHGGVLKTIGAARLAGVARLILVSVFPEAWRERRMPASFEHYMAAKKHADVDLVHSDLDWIVLRPSALTDQPGKGTISLSPAEIHTEISRDDLAETIVALLHTEGAQRRVLEVTSGATPIAMAVEALT